MKKFTWAIHCPNAQPPTRPATLPTTSARATLKGACACSAGVRRLPSVPSTIERQHLLPMAREGFDLVEVSFGQVNGLGCVKVRTNAIRDHAEA